MKMGIIAEDDSDVAVVREVTSKLLRPHKVGFRRFVGDGCGKLRRKCEAWARILVQQGCSWIVVVHDLDMYHEQELRAELDVAVAPARARASVVLIPKREIEAWLLYDAEAIAKAFHEHQPPRVPGNPELLRDPKKHLGDLIWTKYRKDYLNTLHNALIAKYIDVALLRRSQSFAPHFVFTRIVRGMVR
jgi:Domain of unknown function (DUF4276)